MSDRLRIISPAPTQTEILAALDLAEAIVGVTEDCVFPIVDLVDSLAGSLHTSRTF